jgi:hypothetical protein
VNLNKQCIIKDPNTLNIPAKIYMVVVDIGYIVVGVLILLVFLALCSWNVWRISQREKPFCCCGLCEPRHLNDSGNDEHTQDGLDDGVPTVKNMEGSNIESVAACAVGNTHRPNYSSVAALFIPSGSPNSTEILRLPPLHGHIQLQRGLFQPPMECIESRREQIQADCRSV